MIILFEENETQFNSLGIGILSDSIEAPVTEKLNGTFELSLSYPVNGRDYDKLKVNRLIYCKPNPYDEAQPFRICSITKPIKGVVTVDAIHISYDMNGIPVKAIDSKNLADLLSKIQNGEDKIDPVTGEIVEHIDYAVLKNNFTFTTDISSGKTYKTTKPANLRALLMGGEESIMEEYKAELQFDKFMVKILEHRGFNRGARVTYGHNMTDLNHQSTTELLYNGVFPYYHTEKTSTETSTEDKFKQVYIVGSIPFQENWLSYTKDGEPYHPLDESPVQIASEGDYKEKVYCWNPIYQKYEEKIYNEQVTLIQGLLEPTWLSIDWSKFPRVTCKANRKGYFKKATDNEWGEIKGVGDTIFEGSIVSSGIIENIILFFAEVIPTADDKTNEEVSEIVDVQLDDPIIWLSSTDAQSMRHNSILSLDLTSEFDEEPSKERLRAKAEEYINEHKIGTIKHSTSVSFIDISRTTDADKYKNFDRIELGDTVKVSYLDLGVDVELRVISTVYDAVSEKYTNVELGEKKDTMSSESVQTGDDVSSLTNDAGYASVTTVHKLIAETVTANYIEAVNAKLTSAMIKQLEVEKISCVGIIEASQYVIDKLVATLLTADNAVIKDTLTAGKLQIAGDVSIYSGQISIHDQEGNQTFFTVDRKGNVVANSIEITGGTINVNDGMFEVQNDGTMFARNAYIEGEIHATAGDIGGCEIINGILKVPLANIEGELTAKKITVKDAYNRVVFNADSEHPNDTSIAGFSVTNKYIKSGEITSFTDDTHNGVYIGADGIRLGKTFTVDSNGLMKASALIIEGGYIGIDENFVVSEEGLLYATGADIEGTIYANAGYIGGCEIVNGILKIANVNISEKLTSSNIDVSGVFTAMTASITNLITNTIDTHELNADNIKSGTITASSINLGGGNFRVDNEGNVSTQNPIEVAQVNSQSSKIQHLTTDVTMVNNMLDLFGHQVVYYGFDTMYNIDVVIRFSNNIVKLDTNKYKDTITLTMYNRTSGAQVTIPKNTTVAVQIKYVFAYSDGSNSVRSRRCEIPMYYGSSSSSIDMEFEDNNLTSVQLYTAPGDVGYTLTPSFIHETTKVTNGQGIGFISNIAPTIQNHYNCGDYDFEWSDVYAYNYVQTSDRKLKTEIDYTMERYDGLLYKLRPANYIFINGNSGRRHLGLIAQDLEDSLTEMGIETKDCAAITKTIKDESKDKEVLTDEDYGYGIRYSELHALEIYEIQKLRKYVESLEKRIEELESK